MRTLIVAIMVLIPSVILAIVPIIYIAPIPGCHCNIPPDTYESVTRHFTGIGGESIQGHYTFYFAPTVGISLS